MMMTFHSENFFSESTPTLWTCSNQNERDYGKEKANEYIG